MSFYKLEEVNPNSYEHVELLYKLLINKKNNISHEKTPELKDHISLITFLRPGLIKIINDSGF